MNIIVEHRASEILDEHIPVQNVTFEELDDMERTACSLLRCVRHLIRKKKRYEKAISALQEFQK